VRVCKREKGRGVGKDIVINDKNYTSM
jgi:hypothetical protein